MYSYPTFFFRHFPQRRRGIGRACTNCASAHTACDRETPSCGRCMQWGLPDCYYPESSACKTRSSSSSPILLEKSTVTQSADKSHPTTLRKRLHHTRSKSYPTVATQKPCTTQKRLSPRVEPYHKYPIQRVDVKDEFIVPSHSVNIGVQSIEYEPFVPIPLSVLDDPEYLNTVELNRTQPDEIDKLINQTKTDSS